MITSTSARNASVDAMVDLVDVGSTNPSGRILLKTAQGATLLATIPLHTTAFHASGAQGGAGAGSQPATIGKAWLDVTSATIEDATPDANGTCTWAEIIDRDEAVIFSGDVGVSASGEFLELNSTTISTTVPVSITNGNINQPAGSA
jgi:hypothetical protein